MADHSSESPVTVVRRGPAAWMTINRPEAMNALSGPVVGGLRAAVARLAEDPGLRVLVLAGAGAKAFSAGADLKERRSMTLDETRAYVAALGALCDELGAFPRPVIAALGGMAFGGGLELALACDIRLAAEGIEIGLLEVRVGIIPGAGGTQRLSRLVGLAAAKELTLTGRRIGAARARELGLVSEVVPVSELDACVERWVADIAACAPLAVAQAKRTIDAGRDLPLSEALALEAAAYAVVVASEDRNEGLLAFAERRKPVFTGR